tara:strand:+ start:635 stop:784 length:150 start_codon:yes stop_codon:yes gene_type:complete
MEQELEKLEKENEALRETCEVLADEKTMDVIKKSLKQIAEGKGIPLSQL